MLAGLLASRRVPHLTGDSLSLVSDYSILLFLLCDAPLF